jgi:hypothetical protein
MKMLFNGNFYIIMVLMIFSSFGCKKDNGGSGIPEDTWDIEVKGIPKFIRHDYVELSKISRVSKFRSGVGHDYSDAFEHCRSMKHYFEPKSGIDWTGVKIFSPISGKVTRVEQEWAGTKIEIVSDSFPAFRVTIFHVNLSAALQVGDNIIMGQPLGTHIGAQTMSDVSVIVNDPTRQGRMVSYFSALSDEVFTSYVSRGVIARDDLIISKSLRDAHPLQCNGDIFVGTDSLINWVELN